MNCLKRRTCLNLSIFLAFVVLVCPVSAQPVIELIYFVPDDVGGLDQQSDLERIVDYVAEGQKFFATEMDRLGFEPKTFEFNKEVVVVHGKMGHSEPKFRIGVLGIKIISKLFFLRVDMSGGVSQV